MKGFISKTIVAGCLAAGLATGCCGYYDVVDPCYPQRYNFTARQEVCGALTPQVKNGHILDQTIWNWQFERNADGSGTDRLTPAGMDHLIYVLRRRPAPDPTIYLATAEDIAYDVAHAEAFADARSELDAKRVVAIQKYLTAQTAGRGINFQVVVHDPAEADLPAAAVGNIIRGYYPLFTAGGGGGGAPGGGGGAPAGGGR